MYRADLSRRLGPVFAEIAAQARKPSMEEHKAEYRARPLTERLNGVFAEVADTVPNPAQVRAMANPQIAAIKVPSKAYKPTHGGYPG